MSSFVSKAGPESEWGSDSRIAAVRRWHEKSVASRHDQSVLLLDGADLRPGLRVLDLACGAGTPALAEARRVGPRGNVVGTDTSEAMLSLAREYAQEEGLANAEFRVADAGALPFEDGSFDRVTSGVGAMGGLLREFFPRGRARGEGCGGFFGGGPPAVGGFFGQICARFREAGGGGGKKNFGKFLSGGSRPGPKNHAPRPGFPPLDPAA